MLPRALTKFFDGQKQRVAAQLVRDYPGLEGQDSKELAAIAHQAYAQVMRGWPYFVFGCGAMAASFFLVIPLLSILSNWFDIPRRFPLMAASMAGACVLYLFRRVRTRRITTRLVAAAYPGLYCPCGYCLRGHPAVARCPECGTERPPLAQPKST